MQLNGRAHASNTRGKQLGLDFKSQYWNKKKHFCVCFCNILIGFLLQFF